MAARPRGRRRRRAPRLAQAGADSSSTAPAPAAAISSRHRQAASAAAASSGRPARSPRRPARGRGRRAARRPRRQQPGQRRLTPRGSPRSEAQAVAARCRSLPLAQAASAPSAAGVAPSSELHHAASRSTLASSPASSTTTPQGRSPVRPSNAPLRRADARRAAASAPAQATASRSGASSTRHPRRTGPQPQPGGLDHAERPERPRVELVQVVAGHVLHDAAAAVRARAIRERDFEPEHAVARPAEALRARPDRRRRERAAERRAGARRIERQLPARRRRERLDLGERRPDPAWHTPRSRRTRRRPRARRWRAGERRRAGVPEVEAAAAAADHAGERELAERAQRRRQHLGSVGRRVGASGSPSTRAPSSSRTHSAPSVSRRARSAGAGITARRGRARSRAPSGSIRRRSACVGKIFSGIADAVGFEARAQPLHRVEVGLAEHQAHEVALLGADAVLAGERAARGDAGRQDLGAGRDTRASSSGSRRSKEMFGCRLPSPAWNTFARRRP